MRITTLYLSLVGASLSNAAALSGSSNLYLATCEPTTSRGRNRDNSLTVVIYYDVPVSRGASPTEVVTVDAPAEPWEGSRKRAALSTGTVDIRISADATGLSKSQIAGTGRLGREDLVCFVDGTATFQFESRLLGNAAVKCVADYWCASLGDSA